MKFAVIFLLLGISSFIETSNGLVPKLNKLGQSAAEYQVRSMQAIYEKATILKKCPEEERKTREKCLIEDLLHILNILSIDLGCTVEQVFELLELPLDILNLLKLNDITALLEIVELDQLLSSVIRLVEGLLAQVNMVLKQQLVIITNLLESTLDLNIIGFLLHDTVGQILSSLTGTLLGTVLGILGSILGGLGR
ncbi:uncharacterized protein ACMZJ9_003761 isoform 3-T4 [Mantella aurantiaca]